MSLVWGYPPGNYSPGGVLDPVPRAKEPRTNMGIHIGLVAGAGYMGQDRSTSGQP